MKKPDQSVFDGLPLEYQWVAVDSEQNLGDGGACFAYTAEPQPNDIFCEWQVAELSGQRLVGYGYDSADWKNSLIRRNAEEVSK